MFTDVCPDRTNAAMLLMMKITTSCPTCSNTFVMCSPFFLGACYSWYEFKRCCPCVGTRQALKQVGFAAWVLCACLSAWLGAVAPWKLLFNFSLMQHLLFYLNIFLCLALMTSTTFDKLYKAFPGSPILLK